MLPNKHQTLRKLKYLPKLNLEDIEAKVQKIPLKLIDLEGCKVLNIQQKLMVFIIMLFILI